MNIAITLPRPPTTGQQEQRFVLHDLTWQDYLTLGRVLRDRPGLRMTFDRGTLELMTTSHLHERYKVFLHRLLDTLVEEAGLEMIPGGQMTFQREDLDRGLEADQCYWIEHEAAMRSRREWLPQRDPPPDLAVEIEVSRSALNRLAIFAALGVPEVWRFDGEQVHVHRLQADGTYAVSERSGIFPHVPMTELGAFLQPGDDAGYMAVNRRFRQWLRALPPPTNPESI